MRAFPGIDSNNLDYEKKKKELTHAKTESWIKAEQPESANLQRRMPYIY